MTRVITIQPLTDETFAPFGEVLEAKGPDFSLINLGKCKRFNDLATLDIADGRTGISLFLSEARQLPYQLDLMERHPRGSQAFIPMTQAPFLVIVARDSNGRPVDPQAFKTRAGQGINFHRNVWHGVLTPLSEPGLFAVVDRIGSGGNLEEYIFQEPYLVQAG